MSKHTSPISGLRHVALAVEGYETVVDFYSRLWGLELVAGGDGLAYLGSPIGAERYLLRIRKDAGKRVDLVSFACTSRAEVDALAARLARANVRIDRQPAELATPGGGYGVRFFDVDGRLIEVSADVVDRAPRARKPGEAVPSGLSHVVFNTTNIDVTRAFYEEHLGLRLSDWLEDFMCFLRCGTQHHILALARGPHVSLNHVSYEMGGIDAYMRATGRLVRAGCKPIWGPGRHGAGDNTFSYFLDPAGNIAEFTTEMETVNEADWIVRRFAATPEAQDQWGTAGLVTDAMIPAMFNAPDRGLWVTAPV